MDDTYIGKWLTADFKLSERHSDEWEKFGLLYPDQTTLEAQQAIDELCLRQKRQSDSLEKKMLPLKRNVL
jgi:hypothetical protein